MSTETDVQMLKELIFHYFTAATLKNDNSMALLGYVHITQITKAFLAVTKSCFRNKKSL